MPPFKIAEAANPGQAGLKVRPVRAIVLVLVLVLDFLFSGVGFLSAFGFRI
jgi:hypothetical protein